MKALIEMTPKDKIEIIFDLFPNEITPFIAFVLDATSSIRKFDMASEMIWQDDNYTFTQVKDMIHTVESGLLDFLISSEQTTSMLAHIFCGGIQHFWTERCLLGYIYLDTNLKFTMAHDLFFNPNDPKLRTGNFMPLLNN